ncbi:MAG: hypothetical protein QG594_1945 [Bacteroidota bacterium]|nr:hypothetical protein [Bacteroidota bacterium]
MDQNLLDIINNFANSGQDYVIGKRNTIKLFDYQSTKIIVKSFKPPFFLQAIIYRFFRISKAKRSYEHAKILESKNFNTPKPIAYFENKSTFFLLDSYYISEQIIPDFLFKDLIEKDTFTFDLPQILKQFTQFTFRLHQEGIEFLDHSPGNSLFKKNEDGIYEIYLVDLNRMKFHHSMSFEQRMKNLSRITPSKEMIEVISAEYALLYKKDANEVFDLLWKYTASFQEKYYRKIRIKKRLFFWK